MTTILLVGDLHASDVAPANCTDTYLDDLLDMLAWTAKLAIDLQVDTTVWAGDVFNHKAPSKNSHALVLRMIEAVKAYPDLWIVPGNHDMSNDVHASVRAKQPLGVLLAAGAHELDGWHPTLPLYGVPWRQDWTTNDRAAWSAFEGWRAEPGRILESSLAVTHAPIYPPGASVMFDLVPTGGPTGLSAAMNSAGALFYGHIHEDHGVWEDGGVTYANMGALSRGSLTEYNVNRTVKVCVWTNEPSYGSSDLICDYTLEAGFTQIEVPARPASEVFRLVTASEAKGKILDLSTFLESVGSSTLAMSSTASVIEHIRTMPDVPEPVITRAVGFLEEADHA